MPKSSGFSAFGRQMGVNVFFTSHSQIHVRPGVHGTHAVSAARRRYELPQLTGVVSSRGNLQLAILVRMAIIDYIEGVTWSLGESEAVPCVWTEGADCHLESG